MTSAKDKVDGKPGVRFWRVAGKQPRKYQPIEK